MTPLEAPTEDGGCMPELAPPGELCSGKLGEFSQAFRADSIFESKGREGVQITTRDSRGQGQSRPQGAGVSSLLPAQGWCYLQCEISSGEGHWGEANGPLDMMIPPEDGDTLCQPCLEMGGKETMEHGSWGSEVAG